METVQPASDSCVPRRYLSGAEAAFAHLDALGLSNADTAASLGLTPGDVARIRQAVKKKTGDD